MRSNVDFCSAHVSAAAIKLGPGASELLALASAAATKLGRGASELQNMLDCKIFVNHLRSDTGALTLVSFQKIRGLKHPQNSIFGKCPLANAGPRVRSYARHSRFSNMKIPAAM